VNRGALAEIDISALRHNLGIVNTLTGNKPVIAVVKADAYGHGAAEIAARLSAGGVSHFAVAYTGEGRALRESGIQGRIIVLFDRTDLEDFFEFDLTPVISDLKTAETFSSEACKRGVCIRVHLKIDTGMGRTGLMPDAAVASAVQIASMKSIELEGIMSHFSEADLQDRSYALRQINIFNAIRQEVAAKTGLAGIMCHFANSAAILSLKEAFFDAVRPGIMLYGCSPFHEDFGLRPVMRVSSRILALRSFRSGSPVSYGRTFVTARESLIAVIPCGYADGYNRLFSNNAEMLVRGKRAPVVGRVCMDATMVDVTDIPGVSEGDETVLLGSQGSESISARELSGRINTIPYEIVLALGSRARKEYRD